MFVCFFQTGGSLYSTHPLPHTLGSHISEHLHLLPQYAIPAISADLGASLHSKYQEDDEAHDNEEPKNNSNGLKEKVEGNGFGINKIFKDNNDVMTKTTPRENDMANLKSGETRGMTGWNS